MLESQLLELFTEEEFLLFMEFMNGRTTPRYSIDPITEKKEKFYYVYDIQIFIHAVILNEVRLQEIISMCVEKFPQIIGYISEVQ